MRISTGQKIKGHFEGIHKALGEMQERCDTVIYNTAKRSYQNASNFKGDYYRSQQDSLLADANKEITECKQRCIQKVDREYANIQIALDAWITQPLPDAFASTIDTFSRFDITPTRAEIAALQEAGQGSYLAGRLLDGLCRKNGLLFDFESIEVIKRSLQAAKADTHTAVTAYHGVLENNRYAADLIDGFVVSPSHLQNYFVFAEDFVRGERESSLTRIEKSLTDATETDFDLLPSKRSQIAALFDGADETEKVVIAARIIEDGGNLADMLPLFDKALYAAACDYIRENATREAVKAVKARQDAENTLSESATQLAKATAAASRAS